MLLKEEVKYIAHLSRIHLTDKEIETLSNDLGDILAYIEKLKQLDISNVEPTSHILSVKNVFREDSVCPSLSHKEVMDLAVEKLNGSFKVPKVIE